MILLKFRRPRERLPGRLRPVPVGSTAKSTIIPDDSVTSPARTPNRLIPPWSLTQNFFRRPCSPEQQKQLISLIQAAVAQSLPDARANVLLKKL